MSDILNISTLGHLVNNTTPKGIPNINDMLPVMDSQDKNLIKKMPWSSVQSMIDGKAPLSHTHVKADITDFTHSHVKTDITDFAHNHNDLYYTKSQLDNGIFYVTSNTVGTEANKWTKIATLTLTYRYDEAYFNATIQNYADSLVVAEAVSIRARIYQSAVMGNNPNARINLYETDTSRLSASNIMGVLTQVDGSASVMEIWVRIPTTWSSYRVYPQYTNGNVVYHQSQGFETNYPSGTTVAPVEKLYVEQGSAGLPVTVNVGSDATNQRWVRVASLTSATTDSEIQLLYSGSGDFGTAQRATFLILFTQRNDNPTMLVYGFNRENVTDIPLFRYKKIGTYLYEIWVREANYNRNKSAIMLNGYGSQINMDSVTSTQPSDLVTVTPESVAHTGNPNVWLPLAYPVGSIYISTLSTNPATLFGFGTWVAKGGCFLIGADGSYAGGSTGGAVTHTHTMAHTHSLNSHTHGSTGLYAQLEPSSGSMLFKIKAQAHTTDRSWSVSGSSVSSTTSNRYNAVEVAGTTDGPSVANTGGVSTANTGSGSTLPPYLAVYIWERTA